MNKIEITDEMVGRARETLIFHLHEHCSPDTMSRALEAALNPTEGIPVSEGMIQAGRGILNRFT